MSEKRVNVKITASVSDFEKAMKKAQKEIKELSDKIEDINKSKVGDTLEKQFKDITESAEEMKKQMEEMKESLDDIDKVKFDKLEKQLKDIIDSAKDLSDALKDVIDNIDDLDKTKFDKLEKAFENTTDEIKKLGNETKDVVENIKDLDRAADNIDGSGLRELKEEAKDADKHVDNITESMKELNNKTKEIGDSKFKDFGESVKNANQDVENLKDNFSEFNEDIAKTSGLSKLTDGIGNIKKDLKDVFDFKGGGEGGLLDSPFMGSLAGTTIGAKQFSNAIQDVKTDLDKLIDSMKDMSQFTFEEQVKNYDEFIKEAIKAEEEYNNALKERQKLEEEYDEKLFDRGTFAALAEEERQNYEELRESYEEAERQLADYQEQLNKLNSIIEEHNQRTLDWANKNEVVTANLEEQRKVVQDLEKDYNESADGVKDFDKVLADLIDRVHDIGKSFDDLGFDSKLAKGLSNELKNMNFDDFHDGIFKLDYAGNTFEDVCNKIIDGIEKLNGMMDKTNVNAYSDEIQRLIQEYRDLWDAVGEGAPDDIVKTIRDVLDNLDNLSFEEGYESLNKWTKKLKEGFELVDKLEDAWAKLDKIAEDNSAAMDEYDNSINKVRESQEKLNKLQEEQAKLDTLEKGKEVLDDYGKELEETYKVIKDLQEELGDTSEAQDEMIKSLEKLRDEAKATYENYEDFNNSLNESERNLDEVDKKLEQLETDMAALNETLAKSNKFANDSVKEFDKEYKMYEKLSKKVKEYLEDESKSIVLREKVAKSFKEVSDAMEKVYKDSSKLNNADLITKTLEDAAKYIEELDIVSTKNLQADLERLGEIIDDKTKKIKRFKELNKTFGTDDGKAAHWLEQEAEAIKDVTNKTGFAIEAADTLRKAWGDVSIGGEDHLKIRARAEALSDYGETLKRNIRDIRSYYYELETLDEIYEQATDDQKRTIDDYRAWEKSREELVKYNKAIQDYVTTLLDAGGQIDDKFLTDGKFDIDKFIKDFEKMGTSTMVLSKQINAIKASLLENLKVQKETAQNAVKNAKANLEAAKANQQAAQSEEELAEAKERVTKAEKELADAKEKSRKIDKDRIDEAEKLVKAFNEQAEALRKLGIAVEDINKADISKFDKSLGSILDGNGAFGDDIFKSFGDLKEDLLAVFMEFDSFNLGDLADGLGDVLGGIFAAIPPQAKLAIAAIGAVVVALNKLYESGKQQFFEGLEKGFNFLSKIGDIARDVGQEVKDAFEDITGTNLDWSSLMALGPEFEYQMAKVGAIAGSNEKQLEQLIAKAKELGGTTQYKASEVGEAFEYMAMAGYDTEEMLSSINGTLSLSIASGTDLASTTDIVTDYMTALGLEANSTNDFVDKLAATITSSNTTVEKWGQSMKNVASQAGALGIGMTELSTAIGLMANAGVKGSKAGTALKNVLANMAAPTEKQAAALKELGFEADKETGSYLITDDDGNVDLDATMKKLMESTKDLDKAEKAALLTAIAGKEALPGLMALMSQGTEGWDELSDTIENSTGKVQFWNECMSLAGKSGEDAVAAIDNMKEVFAKVESEGLDAGLSVEELSHAIAILGDDGKVAENDVKGLINVIDSMNTSTGEAEEAWRALDKAGDDVINTSYDYDATVAKLMADTSGLSQEKKKLIREQLKEAKTYEEANKILKDYGLTAERSSFANMSYADKLQYLRDNLKGLSDEQIKTELTNLGLADSFDEVLEVLKMTDEEFKKYQKNLGEVEGMAKSLSEAMDETTKAGLLELASAIENVAIAAFENLKPAINEAVKALNEFFTTWHNDGDNKFTFEGFDLAFNGSDDGKIDGLADKIVKAAPQIKQAVIDLFNTVNELVEGGTLESILDIGTSIIQNICDGILESEDTLDDTIDSFIKKICAWIQENGPKVKEAGKMLLDAITEGIENNEGIISDAMNTICDIITTWTNSSGELKAAAGLFAEQFVGLALENMWIGVKNWFKEKLTAFAELFTGPFDIGGAGGGVGLGLNLASNIMEGVFGSDPLGEAMEWLTDKLGGFNILEFIGDLLFGVANPFGSSGLFSASKLFGDWNPIEDIKGWFNDKIGDWSFVQWAKDKLTGKDDSKDSKDSNKKTNKKTTKKLDQVEVETLVNIDEKELSEVEDALVKLETAAQKAAKTIRTEFVNMTNIARNQMLNISNIIRNQAINWANIIKNQAKNARDGFTQQMISMASVARTQLVNVSNIIRNQSLSWYNVINNQAKRARDAFTQQMMSMVKVARNQMYNVLTTVRSYMSQISSATNKTMRLNVNQTISGGSATLPVTPAMISADALYAANAASVSSLDVSGLSSRASSVSGFNSSSLGTGMNESNIIHTHVYLEGREIARASAKYMSGEIKAINKRENRKRGVK